MKTHEGRDAWRNGFSTNAANVLQIYRVFAPMTDDEFKAALVACARHSKGRKTNETTVCAVLQVINDSRKELTSESETR